jgi:thiol-disulfide isomerase/thioredoxin
MSPRRRQLTLALVGGGAALAGLAGGWWHHSRTAVTGNPGDAPPPDFWQLSFDTPDGQTLALASFRGKPLLLNFWATWCPPCVKEMPQIDAFHRQKREAGWQVIGLAVDGPTPVREFLARTPVSFPIGLAGLGGTELSRQLGNGPGGLPFTVHLDGAGRVAHRKLGETNLQELLSWT